MKKSKFSPNQIVKILATYSGGKPASEVCREHGEVSDLKRLKALEAEKQKLKRMYSELALDHQMAKEIIEKKL